MFGIDIIFFAPAAVVVAMAAVMVRRERAGRDRPDELGPGEVPRVDLDFLSAPRQTRVDVSAPVSNETSLGGRLHTVSLQEARREAQRALAEQETRPQKPRRRRRREPLTASR